MTLHKTLRVPFRVLDIANMPHSDVQQGINDQRTPMQTGPQLRELRINGDRMPKILESPHADESGRPRPRSANSQRSGFSVIVEEDVGTSQVGSPERLGRMSPHHRYVAYVSARSAYLSYDIGLTSRTPRMNPRALHLHPSAGTPANTPPRPRWRPTRQRPHPP